jgi:uncharacterized protein YutE (UPF0331/DUF86 family)
VANIDWEFNDLERHVVSIKETLLSKAIAHYCLSKDYERFVHSQPNSFVRHEYAISSVSASFMAHESFLNYYKHLVLSFEDSPIYIPVAQRSVLLTEHLNAWINKSAISKYRIILELLGANPISSKLSGNLREFANYRNLLFHGYCFQRDMLLETTEGDGWAKQDVVDYEDIFEDRKAWPERFNNLRFNTLDAMDHTDAEKCLRVALDAIRPLLEATGDEFHVFPIRIGMSPYRLTKDSCDLEKLKEELPSGKDV